MDVTQMALLAAVAWIGADLAIVGGWLATVGLVRRRTTRRATLYLGFSTRARPVGVALRSGTPERIADRSAGSGTRGRGRAS